MQAEDADDFLLGGSSIGAGRCVVVVEAADEGERHAGSVIDRSEGRLDGPDEVARVPAPRHMSHNPAVVVQVVGLRKDVGHACREALAPEARQRVLAPGGAGGVDGSAVALETPEERVGVE